MQNSRIADRLARAGFLPKAAALDENILKLKPDDGDAALQAARALAVHLERRADAGQCRDVTERIAPLAERRAQG